MVAGEMVAVEKTLDIDLDRREGRLEGEECRRLAMRGILLRAMGGGKRWAWNRLKLHVAEGKREGERKRKE